MDGLIQRQNKSMQVQSKKQEAKKQFQNGINDHDMMTAVIKDITPIKGTNEITSEQVLSGAQRNEAQRAQKAILDTIMKDKEFETLWNHA